MTLNSHPIYIEFPIKIFLILSVWVPLWNKISIYIPFGFLIILFLIFMLVNSRRFSIFPYISSFVNVLSQKYHISAEHLKIMMMIAFLPSSWIYVLLFLLPFLGISFFRLIPQEFLIMHVIASHMSFPLVVLLFVFYFRNKLPQEYQISFTD